MSQNEETIKPDSQPQDGLLSPSDFAARIRQKHPKVYDSLDDEDLTRRVLNKYPEYRSHVRLDNLQPRPSVSSSIREDDAAFDVPLQDGIPDFKPIEFKPFETSDLSLGARVAAGGARIGGADLAALPEESPLRTGKILKASIQNGGQSYPNEDELSDAALSALGALQVGQRYRAETGRNLALPTISHEDLIQGYDSKTGTYHFEFAPSRADVAVINAYARGGIKAAEDEIAKMRAEVAAHDTQQAKAREVAREQISKLGINPDEVSEGNGAVLKGIGDAAVGMGRLINNASAFGRDAKDSARSAEQIESFAASMPEEKTAVGRLVRGASGIAARAPQFMAGGAAAAPYLAAGLGVMENIHRGKAEAVKQGYMLGATGAVAHGVGEALQALSPAARQIAARHLAGTSNLILNAGNGRHPIETYLEGALMPVGKSKTPEKYTHPALGDLVAVPNQEGIGKGWVRVQTADGEIGVVRRPNPQGQGGVTNADGSLPAPSRRPGEAVLDAVNIPRATQTAFDASSLGRQSIVLAIGHPVKAARAFARSVPTFFSESSASKLQHEIESSPHAPLRQEAGLYLADYHHNGQSLLKGEEGFQSNLAQYIPGVRGSERGFNAMTNKLRADVFDSYVDTHPDATPETLQGIASFINDATGRASLGKFGEKHAAALSQLFYSPRFQLSRASMLTRPFRGTPEARSFAAVELLKYVGAGVGLMQMAKMGGLQVGMNPLSSDFGKIKIGNTRISIWGGTDTAARYVAQMVTGKATELESGRTVNRSPLKTALNFLRTRAAPQVSVPFDTALGSTATGEKASANLGLPFISSNEDWRSGLARRALMPLAWRDIEDAVTDDLANGGNGWGGALRGAPSLLGFGANTITPKNKEEIYEQEVKRLAADPESKGLTDQQLRHNARVSLEARRLIQMFDDSDLSHDQIEQLRYAVNKRLYTARARVGDSRELSAIERVFDEKLRSTESYLKGRLEPEKERAELRKRIVSRIEKDVEARQAQGLGVTSVKITRARAKEEAEREGVDLNLYLEALSDAGVHVID